MKKYRGYEYKTYQNDADKWVYDIKVNNLDYQITFYDMQVKNLDYTITSHSRHRTEAEADDAACDHIDHFYGYLCGRPTL